LSALTFGDSVRLRGLHVLARIALVIRPPLQAKAIVDWAARRAPPLRNISQAQEGVRILFPWGSCLSRAIAVAAALPEAEVVIGVDPWSSARLRAHAWLEIRSIEVDTNPTSEAGFPPELARLPAARLVPEGRVQVAQR
jgi:hypothetical protein